MKNPCRALLSAMLFTQSFLFLTSCAGGGGTGTERYRYAPVPGKTIGVWPDNWTTERLAQLRTRYGFNHVMVPVNREFYDNALQAGFPSTNIAVAFAYGGYTTAVDELDSPMYCVDEAVEHKCNGEPSAGKIHTPEEKHCWLLLEI